MLIYNFVHLFADAPTGCAHDFLGLTPWFKYLPPGDFGQTVTSTVATSSSLPTSTYNGTTIVAGTKCDITSFNLLGSNSDFGYILVAVVDDLLRIAGLVAFTFIIVSAVKFITSEGNPENATNARNTLINALIGLAITITATIFVSFIGNQIGS
jgi:FtsH-binding integral membrane protein